MKKLNYLLIGLILLYLLPAFVQPDFTKDGRIQNIGVGLPRVLSGDEPAYVLATYSLVKDLDVDLGNNYEQAIKGGFESGYNFKYKNFPINERSVHYMYKGKNYDSFLFDSEVVKKELLKDKFRIFEQVVIYDFHLKEGFKDFIFNNFEQPPVHPIGLPLFNAIFLWPLKDSYLLETGTIFLSILMSLISLFFLYQILLYYKRDTKAAFLIMAIMALGTTLWFYSKTLFPDPLITSFLLISYYLFLVRKQIFLPAIFLGIGLTAKYPFVIFPLVFCFYLLFKRRISDLIKFGIIVSIFGFLLLFFNYSLYGALFSQGYKSTGILMGLIGIIFSPTEGTLFFIPFLVFAIFGIKKFYQVHRDKALFTFALILAYYFFISTFHGWWGGVYSCRNILPIIPLLAIPLYFWYINNRSQKALYIFYGLAIISIIINFQAAFFHFIFWGGKPFWHLISLVYSKFHRVLEIFFF